MSEPTEATDMAVPPQPDLYKDWRGWELVCANSKCAKRFMAGYKYQVRLSEAGFPVYCCTACGGTARSPSRQVPKKVVVRCPWATGALPKTAEHVPFHA